MATVAKPSGSAKGSGLKAWFYKRLPIEDFIRSQLTGYYAPKNFNLWYFFGFIGATSCD